MSDLPVPLLNDPKRDATPTLRGFSYQILRTIEAWLDLAADEILLIEGAEDLDRVGPAGAVVEQVKDTAGSGGVTLRTKGALEAIANLIAHQDRNPGVRIDFRFLTTSPVSREASDPMGFGMPGIEAWASVRRDPTSAESLRTAEAIRSFLAGLAALEAKAKAWIAGATAAQFIERCVKPMEWITGQGDIEALTNRLEARLIELGETLGLSAQDSLKALDALHRRAWCVATDRDRQPLRRGDLLRIVDEAGRTSLPTADLARLLALLAPGVTPTDVAITPDSAVEGAPSRSPRHLARPELEALLSERQSRGVLSIHGGTGMGKTDLAIGVTSASREIGWVNLRDGDSGTALAKLWAVEATIRIRGQAISLVLDDLDPGDDPRLLEPVMAAVARALRDTGSCAIVTSAQPLPPRLAAALGLNAEQIVQAPSFEEDEVKCHLSQLGCPEELVKAWGKLVWATTGGHPQLVHARAEALSAAGFPKPTYDDFLRKPQDVVDVEAEARRIVSVLPAEQRDLLCRASLLTGRQPRERLLRIARIEPAIEDPGDVIDRLAGPWLELVDGGQLRSSPLLRDLGTQVRGEEWVRAMHAGAAYAYIAGRTLPATDISSILMHCLIGQTAGPLVRIMPSLLQAPPDVWQQIGETAGVFVHVGVGAGADAPFGKPTDLAAFRILQFRIAAEKDAETARAVIERALSESADAGEEADFFTLLLLWQVVLAEHLQLTPAERVEHAIRFARLGERIQASLPARMAAKGVENFDGEWPETGPLAAIGALAAINDADGLDRVLDALENAAPDDARMLMRGFDGRPDFAGIAMTRVWLSESSGKPPRWAQLADTLKRTVIVASTMGAATLATAAGALLVRIIDENVGDPADAEAAADRLPPEVGRSPAVIAAKAKVLLRSDRDLEALALYDEALPRFALTDPGIVDAARDAAVAAARAMLWARSAELFGTAIAHPASINVPARLMGMRADCALALHLAGRSAQAIVELAAAAGPMITSVPPEPDEPTLSTWMRVNEAAKMIAGDLEGDTPMDPSAMSKVVGLCSTLDPFDWSDAKPAPTDVVLLNLARADLAARPVPELAIQLGDRIRTSRNMLLKSVAGATLFDIAVATRDFASVVADTLDQLAALATAKAAPDSRDPAATYEPSEAPAPNQDSLEFARVRILAALFALSATGAEAAVPFARWRADLPVDPEYETTRRLLDVAERCLLHDDKPWASLELTDAWEERLAISLAAFRRQRLSADQLLVCHGIWALYLQQPLLKDMTGATAAAMVTRAWLERTDSPAELVTPRLTVPAIRAATTGGTLGWRRTKAVLLAACGAVSIQSRTFAKPLIDRIEV